jgi:cysteine-rich repeat protein
MRMYRFIFALVLIAGCKKSDGTLVVSVDAAAPLANVARLQIDLAASNYSARTDYAPSAPFALPPPRTVTVTLPPSVAGRLKVHAEALDKHGQLLAEGDTTATVTAGGRTAVSLVLGGSASDMGGDVMDMSGADGGGDGGSDGGVPDMAHGCVSGDGVCGVNCTGSNDSDCAVCGNNVLESGEACDDGNTDNGDGCDPTCQFTNTLSIVAGTPSGIGRADGVGTTARLNSPVGMTTDGTYLYFGDDCTIKRLDPATLEVTTLAGSWGDCRTNDDRGNLARLVSISDVEFEPNGQKGVLHIAGSVTRQLDLTTMMVGSEQGYGGEATGLSFLTTLYLVSPNVGLIQASTRKTLVDPTKLAPAVCTDVLAVDASTFYLACGKSILLILPNNAKQVNPYAGGGNACTNNSDVTKVGFGNINHLSSDGSGGMLATDDVCHVVWRISATNAVSIVAGVIGVAGHADGAIASGTLSAPSGVVSLGGAFFVADSSGTIDTTGRTIRRFDGVRLSTVAGVANDPVISVGANPTFVEPWTIIPNGNTPLLVTTPDVSHAPGHTWKLDLAGNSDSNFNATFALPGVILGGLLYVTATSEDNTISSFALAGGPEMPFAGVSNHANAAAQDGPLASAVISEPAIGATDGTNIYFIDDQLIREVDMVQGMVVTIAGHKGPGNISDGVGTDARLTSPDALTCDGKNLYFIDGDGIGSLSVIRKVELATRKVTTLAGVDGMAGDVDGVGTSALVSPDTLATDGHAVYFTSPGNGAYEYKRGNVPALYGPTIRELELATNRVTTMVGTHGAWTARPGVGLKAAVNSPRGIAFDTASHSLLVVDYLENVVYRIK